MSDKNKEIDLDDDNWSFDFDLGDDFNDMDTPPPPPTGREAAMAVTASAAKGASNVFLAEGRRQELILKALPKEYTAAAQSWDQVSSEVRDVSRVAREQMIKTSKELKRTARSAYPMVSKYLPKSIDNRVKELIKDEPSYGTYNQVDPKEARIQTSTDSIFGSQQPAAAASNAEEVRDEKEAIVTKELKDTIKQVRIDKISKQIEGIGDSLARAEGYRNQVTNGYRKKMLEINYRQLFAMNDLIELNKTSMEKMIPNVERIVHNTALPDYAKEQVKEIYSARLKRSLIDRFAPANFTRDFAKVVSKNAQLAITSFFGAVTESASQMGQAGGLIGGDDFGPTKTPAEEKLDAAKTGAQMGGEYLARKYVSPLVDKSLGKLRGKLDKNKNVSDLGHRAKFVAENYGSIVNTYTKGGGSYDGAMGKFLNPMAGLMSMFAPTTTGEQVDIGNISKVLDKPRPFDNKAHHSITEIIPALLAKIDQSVRSGFMGEEQPLEQYDYKTSQFVTTKEVSNRIRELVGDEDNKEYIRKELDNLVSIIGKNSSAENIDEDKREKIKRIIDAKIRNANHLDVRDLAKGVGFENQRQDLDTQQIFQSAVEGGNAHTLNSYINAQMNRLRHSVGNANDNISQARDMYGDSALASSGILVKNGEHSVINKELLTSFGSIKGDQKLPTYGSWNKRPNISTPAKIESTPDDMGLRSTSGTRGKLTFRKAVALGMDDALFNDNAKHNLTKSICAALEKTKGNTRQNNSLDYTSLITEIRDELTSLSDTLSKGIGNVTAGDVLDEAGRRIKSKMPNHLMSKAKQLAGAGVNQVKRVGGFFGKKAKAGWDWAVAEDHYSTRTGIVSAIRDKVRGIRDIYDADGQLILSAAKLKAGEYFNEAGNPIKYISDIDGNIFDKDRNIVVSKEELKDKLKGLKYWANGKWELAAKMFSSAINKITGGVNSLTNTAWKLTVGNAKKIYKHIRVSQDIYVNGETTPRLLRINLLKGLYVSAVTGNVIRDVYDIDGEVKTIDGNVVISSTEIAADGFYMADKNGKKFDSFTDKIKKKILARWNLGAKLAGKALASVKKVAVGAKNIAVGSIKGVYGAAKKTLKTAKDAFGEQVAKYGFDSADPNEHARRTARSARSVVQRLDIIIELLKERFDSTPKHKRTSAKAKRGRGKVTPTPTHKETPTTVSPTKEAPVNTDAPQNFTMDGEAPIADAIKGMYARAAARKAALAAKSKDASDIIAKKVSENLAGTKKKPGLLSSLFNRTKKSKFGDTDGDGDRDGSFRDIMANRLAKRKEEKARKAAEKAARSGKPKISAKQSNFLGALLGGLGSLLKTPFKILGGIGSALEFFMGGTPGARGGLVKSAVNLAGKVGKGAWNLIKSPGKLIKGAWNVGKMALRSAPGQLLKTAAGTAIRGVASAAIGVISSPWVIGAAVVGGLSYLTYKKLTAVDVPTIDKLRFAYYGTKDYSDAKSDDVARMHFLEATLLKYVKYDKQGFSSLSGLNAKATATIFNGLGVDVKDERRKAMLDDWLFGRFIPVFLLWTSRVKQITPELKLTDIASNKATATKKLTIGKKVHLPEDNQIFKITTGPFDVGLATKAWDTVKFWGDEAAGGSLLDGEEVNDIYSECMEKLSQDAAQEAKTAKADKPKAKPVVTPVKGVKDSEVKTAKVVKAAKKDKEVKPKASVVKDGLKIPTGPADSLKAGAKFTSHFGGFMGLIGTAASKFLSPEDYKEVHHEAKAEVIKEKVKTEVKAKVKEHLKTKVASETEQKKIKVLAAKIAAPVIKATPIAPTATKVAKPKVKVAKPVAKPVVKPKVIPKAVVVAVKLPPSTVREIDHLNALEAIRIKCYGVGDLDVNKVKAIFALEDLAIKYVKISRRSPVFRGNPQFIAQKIAPAFNLDLSDEVALGHWMYWFTNRFLTVFLAYVGQVKNTMGGADPLKISISGNITRLAVIAQHLISFSFARVDNRRVSIWTLATTPFKDNVPLATNKSITNDNYNYLMSLVKPKVVTEQKAPAPKPKPKPKVVTPTPKPKPKVVTPAPKPAKVVVPPKPSKEELLAQENRRRLEAVKHIEDGKVIKNDKFGVDPNAQANRRRLDAVKEIENGKVVKNEKFGVVPKHELPDAIKGLENNVTVRNPNFDYERSKRLAEKAANKLPVGEDSTPEIDVNSIYGRLKLRSNNIEDVVSMISKVAKQTGVSEKLLLTIGQLESSLQPNAAASTSTAKGLYQFVDATWKEQLAKHGDKYGIPKTASPLDPVANAILGAEYLKAGEHSIKARAGKRNVSAVDVYLTHLLGATGGARFIKLMLANPSNFASEDFKSQALANPNLFYHNGVPRSYQEIYHTLEQRANASYRNVARFASDRGSSESIATLRPTVQTYKAIAVKTRGDTKAPLSNDRGEAARKVKVRFAANDARVAVKETEAAPVTVADTTADKTTVRVKESHQSVSHHEIDDVRKQRHAQLADIRDRRRVRRDKESSAVAANAVHTKELTQEHGKIAYQQLEVQNKMLATLTNIESLLTKQQTAQHNTTQPKTPSPTRAVNMASKPLAVSVGRR